MLNTISKINKTETTVYERENKFFEVQTQLFDIFSNEAKREKSILCSYSAQIISKIAIFICSSAKTAAAIGIAGETASGKSTIAYDIIDMLNEYAQAKGMPGLVTRINTDDYYYDRSEQVKAAGSFAAFAQNYDLDCPEALELDLMKKQIRDLREGKEVYLPKYDMSGTAIRTDNHTLAVPRPIIISEGLFNLTEKIANAFDFKIYVDIDRKSQEERFYYRANERNLGASASEVLRKADVGAIRFVRPSKDRADIVLSGAANREDYKKFIGQILNIVENVYKKC